MRRKERRPGCTGFAKLFRAGSGQRWSFSKVGFRRSHNVLVGGRTWAVRCLVEMCMGRYLAFLEFIPVILPGDRMHDPKEISRRQIKFFTGVFKKVRRMGYVPCGDRGASTSGLNGRKFSYLFDPCFQKTLRTTEDVIEERDALEQANFNVPATS